MSTERGRDFEAQVDEALRAFARRCPAGAVEGLDELCAGDRDACFRKAVAFAHASRPQRAPQAHRHGLIMSGRHVGCDEIRCHQLAQHRLARAEV